MGFTPSEAQAANFENSAAAWIVLRMPRTTPGGLGSVATWELHTNGLKGQVVSGTVVLQNYNEIAVSYDPSSRPRRSHRRVVGGSRLVTGG